MQFLDRTLPRLLLCAAPLLCLAQLFVWRTYGEPYPGVISPSFPLISPTEWQHGEARLLRHGTQIRTLSLDELFADVQRSIRPGMILRRCDYENDCSPDTRRWLLQLGQEIDPSATSVEIHWYSVSKEGRQWSGVFPNS